MILSILPFLAPIALLSVAAVSIATPGRRPRALLVMAEGAAVFALVLSFAGAVAVLTGWGGDPGGAFSILRADAVGATLAVLVGLVGWVVVRTSCRLLDGEPREGRFHGLMLATLAGVLVLVQAATLPVMVGAFVGVGLGLRQLLLFYPERPAARRAAGKFAVVWHSGDALLILAAGLFKAAYGTTDIVAIAQASQASMPPTAQGAVALIVMAALFKTAAFPLHGWLTEVMEAPTPVSALLHAGIINAGGVLLLRFAEPVQASPGAMTVLVTVGGFTALFGAVVMLTQSAAKTALAWSTVGQMGFMLLQCGLGLWTLALLHIVAHALYKAHAFLSAGAAVGAVAAMRRPGPVAVPGGVAVARAFGLAIAVYGVAALAFGLFAGPKAPQAVAMGAILVFGVAYLVAQGLADAAPAALTRRTLAASLAAATGYFGFHVLSGWMWGAALPAPPVPGALEWALIAVAVLSFGAVAVAQALFPLWSHHPAAAGLRVHVANGLYLNAALDRMTGGFRTRTPL